MLIVYIQDLTQYKKHTDKGVSMAARSLISLFRTLNRSLLAKIDQVPLNIIFKSVKIRDGSLGRGTEDPRGLVQDMVTNPIWKK